MKSRFRSVLFWAHLVIGVAAALFILSMAVSGICIAYREPLTAWAEHSERTVAIPPGSPRLDLEAVIARAQAIQPQTRFHRVSVHALPEATVDFFSGGDYPAVLFLNPYTGEAAGQGAPNLRAFFAFMTGWHRYLTLSGENRATGKAITAAVSLAFFLLLLSGLCLWLPKKWSAQALRPIAFFRRGLSGKARDWNWHNVIGLWWAPLILILSLTGIIMSYGWAKDLVAIAVGAPTPSSRRGPPPPPKPKPAAPKPPAPPTDAPAPLVVREGVNQLLAIAQQQMPGWQSITMVLPYSPDGPVNFFLNGAEGDGRPDLTAQLVLDHRTAAVQKWEPYASKNAADQTLEWVVPTHTGAVAGLFGETLAVLAAGGAIMLAWTGLSLAWRRFFAGRGA